MSKAKVLDRMAEEGCEDTVSCRRHGSGKVDADVPVDPADSPSLPHSPKQEHGALLSV